MGAGRLQAEIGAVASNVPMTTLVAGTTTAKAVVGLVPRGVASAPSSAAAKTVVASMSAGVTPGMNATTVIPAPIELGGFRILLGKDITSTCDAGSMDANDLAACKLECQRFGCGGFVVFNGKAHFRGDTAGKCLASLEDRPGCTAFINTGNAKSVTSPLQESANRVASAGAVRYPVAGIPVATALVPVYPVSSAPPAFNWAERPVDEGSAPRRPRVSSGVVTPTRRRHLDRVQSGPVLGLAAKDPPAATRHASPRHDRLLTPRPVETPVRHNSPRPRLQPDADWAQGLQREATWAPERHQPVPVEGLQREATWAPDSSTGRGAGALPAMMAQPSPRWRKLEPALNTSRSTPVLRTVRDQAWSHREHAELSATPPRFGGQAAKDGSAHGLDDERGRPDNGGKAVHGQKNAVSGSAGWSTPQTGGGERFQPLTGRTVVGEQGWPNNDWHATKVRRWPINGQNFVEVPVPDRESCHCIVQ